MTERSTRRSLNCAGGGGERPAASPAPGQDDPCVPAVRDTTHLQKRPS